MARRVKEPQDELAGLLKRSTGILSEALFDLAKARLAFNQRGIEKAKRRLGNAIAAAQGLADILGRRRLILEIAAKAEEAKRPANIPLTFATPTGKNPLFPKVPFGEAIEDILDRTPFEFLSEQLEREGVGTFEDLSRPARQRIQQEIKTVYSQEHGFALARSADEAITARVQKAVEQSVRKGLGVPKASDLIQEIGDFTRGYADTVFRTNMNTAYTAGRFRQAQDEDIAQVIGGMRYDAVNDSDVRPNHLAMDGVVGAVNDRIWSTHSPPLGFNCRCTIEHVTFAELQDAALINPDGTIKAARIPSGAGPDPGFEKVGRADLLLYGG